MIWTLGPIGDIGAKFVTAFCDVFVSIFALFPF